jgi:hypothetical protein
MRLPKPSEGGDFKPVPEGNWPAICYGFIDLGTQPTSFGEKRQVRILWELHDEDCVMMEGPKKGQPMMIPATYTWSMNEKATLRKTLETWRGKKFTDREIEEFDVKNLIGQPCMLQVSHNDKGEKVYANVSAVTKPPKGMTFPAMLNKAIYLALTEDEFERIAFENLPDRLKNKIKDSPEYNRLVNGPRAEAPSNYEKVLEDEIPF